MGCSEQDDPQRRYDAEEEAEEKRRYNANDVHGLRARAGGVRHLVDHVMIPFRIQPCQHRWLSFGIVRSIDGESVRSLSPVPVIVQREGFPLRSRVPAFAGTGGAFLGFANDTSTPCGRPASSAYSGFP
jgi:hypothetical protein